MSDCRSPMQDYVFSLSNEEFNNLLNAIDVRIDKETYGFISFEEGAHRYGRIPTCPNCGSSEYRKEGKTKANHQRYQCKSCGATYTILSESIFNYTKISIHKLINYIQLMTYNVPLQLLCETLNIASNTAELWRKKIFSTVNEYQNNILLKDRIWIDETYIEDYEIKTISNGKHLRGLSKSKICICVAIDVHKNMIAIISGHGKPSSSRIMKALGNHIQEGSTIVHDGDFSHMKLINDKKCKEEFLKANIKDIEYQEKMALINNMCSWLKRYIHKFTGMDIQNLQSYLNWFIYLQKVKSQDEIYPKNERILRHLLLSKGNYVRKY